MLNINLNGIIVQIGCKIIVLYKELSEYIEILKKIKQISYGHNKN